MANSEERKKSIRDRKDAYYLGDLDAVHVLTPFMMPGRTNNEAVMTEIVDITAINEYLDKKNATNPEFKYTWFHIISAAIAKTIILRPKMNWFISGHRYYQRKTVEIAFMVKRKFDDHSEEAIAKCVVAPEGGSPVEQVHDYVQKFVHKVRVENQTESTTEKMNILKVLPRFVLKFVFWALRRLEYHGIYPEALKNDDPCYASVFISNLGSIKMNADYHHLYEWGTTSFFTLISEKKMRPFFNPDGSYVMHDSIELGLTIDERIADGYYFAGSIKILRHLLQHPELLDLDANTPVNLE